MTSKERANLRSMASGMDAIFQIGKGNLSDNQIEGLNDALEKRELVKISVLKGCEFSADELIVKLSKRLRAEAVATIGSKIILYRKSRMEGIKHIEF